MILHVWKLHFRQRRYFHCYIFSRPIIRTHLRVMALAPGSRLRCEQSLTVYRVERANVTSQTVSVDFNTSCRRPLMRLTQPTDKCRHVQFYGRNALLQSFIVLGHTDDTAVFRDTKTSRYWYRLLLVPRL